MISCLHDRFLDGPLLPTPHLYFLYFDVLFVANVLARAGLSAAAHLGNLDALARLGFDAEELAESLEEHDEELQSLIESMT